MRSGLFSGCPEHPHSWGGPALIPKGRDGGFRSHRPCMQSELGHVGPKHAYGGLVSRSTNHSCRGLAGVAHSSKQDRNTSHYVAYQYLLGLGGVSSGAVLGRA